MSSGFDGAGEARFDARRCNRSGKIARRTRGAGDEGQTRTVGRCATDLDPDGADVAISMWWRQHR